MEIKCLQNILQLSLALISLLARKVLQARLEITEELIAQSAGTACIPEPCAEICLKQPEKLFIQNILSRLVGAAQGKNQALAAAPTILLNL